MKIRYCLPVLKKSKKEVIQCIEENSNNYDYFEVWLDYITDIDNIFVKEIVNKYENNLICLFQRGNKKIPGINNAKKLQIIELLQNTACYIDLDISEINELDYIQKKNIAVKKIISYHNYQETPNNLPEIVKQIQEFKPDIYKIATFCNTPTDALKLLLLQQNLQLQNKHHIILGMGKFGTITRVYGTLWGNELIYAPLSVKEVSAPGQLQKKELEEIFKILQ